MQRMIFGGWTRTRYFFTSFTAIFSLGEELTSCILSQPS